ncbi:glycosyltransferase [Candidatus Pacearchaeota archaeon]|nr:glycosyltransferase [Candidatus Pacearchaeota archaeon]
MKFSLVIPLAPERNAEIIGSIKKLDYPKQEFQVIVVKGRNPSDNRNKGAGMARGEYICFLDDDAIVDSQLLKNAEAFFERYPHIDIVGGPQLTPKDDKRFAKISGYALSSKFGAWEMAKRYSRQRLDLNADEKDLTSAILFCRKKVMNSVKFDSSLFPGEDPKFIEDSKKAGFKVAYSPELIIYHRRRANVKGMLKQMFNYGKVRPAKESFLNTLSKPFFLIPSIFSVYLIFILAFIIYNPNISFNLIKSITGNITGFSISRDYLAILFVPLILYIIIALIFSAKDAVKNRNLTAFFLLPFVYLGIHTSYGFGMIYGYVKKFSGKRAGKSI